MSELEEWLSYMDQPPALDDEILSFIEKEKSELIGDFAAAADTACHVRQGS